MTERTVQERIDRINAAYELIRRTYPSMQKNNIPLAIGSLQAIKLPISEKIKQQAVKKHTRRLSYIRAIFTPGSIRHDLFGNPVEPVSEEHREHAAKRFQSRKVNRKKRKAKAREAIKKNEKMMAERSCEARKAREMKAIEEKSGRSMLSLKRNHQEELN